MSTKIISTILGNQGSRQYIAAMASPRKTAAKKAITAEQAADAARLKAIYERWAAIKIPGEKRNQTMLGEAIGISQGAVSHYMTGEMILNLEKVIDFALALDCRPEEISPGLTTGLRALMDRDRDVDAVAQAIRDAVTETVLPIPDGLTSGERKRLRSMVMLFGNLGGDQRNHLTAMAESLALDGGHPESKALPHPGRLRKPSPR